MSALRERVLSIRNGCEAPASVAGDALILAVGGSRPRTSEMPGSRSRLAFSWMVNGRRANRNMGCYEALPVLATAESACTSSCPLYILFSMPLRRREGHASLLSARRLSAALAEAGRGFYNRGWVLGTSGNFSAVLRRKPLRLVITTSGIDKSALNAQHFLEIDAHGNVLRGVGKPSAEALLHLAVASVRRAGAIFHTHSVWSTLLSELHAAQGGLAISGYEMLKGLEGVRTHAHSEWLPILENSQDIPVLAGSIETVLRRYPDSHGFLLRAHGLYTWGEDVGQARRHVEILEFLLEVLARRESSQVHPGRA